MGIETISTLLGVILGVALTAVWEVWKSSREARQTKAGVRAIVGSEIDHNIRVLVSIRDAYIAEKETYQRTLKQDEMGGHSSDGNPIQIMKNSPFDSLSQEAWNSQLSQAPSAFTTAEITAIFAFYGNLNWLLEAVERLYSNMKSRTGSGLYLVIIGTDTDEIMNRIKISLESQPKIR